MAPTTDFRWVSLPMGEVGAKHPTALTHGRFALVLQQRWAANLSGEIEQWRDIPMVDSTGATHES